MGQIMTKGSSKFLSTEIRRHSLSRSWGNELNGVCREEYLATTRRMQHSSTKLPWPQGIVHEGRCRGEKQAGQAAEMMFQRGLVQAMLGKCHEKEGATQVV
ncbi:hypothetical protein DL546_009903 [Coniochaeta pulveracea]|uniref:Uncharacterized protein n=1 Tax=Coniochaeta pulveracea TaxID=177199 RepID=A0A420XXI6_9PEZI|nr:hypothetical protein DL546_009903 [Coniochaeta pulveracea]